MAKAIRTPTEPIEDTRDVQLTLTHEEASSLRRVCARIGGAPQTRRGHFDSIARALDGIRVHEPDCEMSGRIRFE